MSKISCEVACSFATVSSTWCSNRCFITGGSSIITQLAAASSVSGASLLARTSARTYLPKIWPAIVSAAGAARRVEIHATLPPRRASASPPPLAVCQSLGVAGPVGAGHCGTWLLRTSWGSRGSCVGGLGTLSPLLLLVPCRERSVSECFFSASSPNSQQGSTMCPEGAISNWKLSVPGGSASFILTSPGPQKCNFNVVKSSTALLSRRAVSPSKPGKSELATAGVL